MLKIRDAELCDAKEIARIKVDTWRSAYKGKLSEEYLNSLSYDDQEQKFSSMISRKDKSFVLVAEEDSQIVAFAAGGKEKSHEYYYEGEVYAIYVLDEHQKKGIGKTLMSHVAKRLTEMGIDSMLTWVLEESPYREFYEELHGKYIERMPYDLVDPEVYLVGYGWKDIDKNLVIGTTMNCAG